MAGGIVTEITSPLSYKVKLSNGSIIRRHIDHICIHYSPPRQDIPTETDINDSFLFPQHHPIGFSVVSWCCTDAPNMTSNITEILKYFKLRKILLFSYKKVRNQGESNPSQADNQAKYYTTG